MRVVTPARAVLGGLLLVVLAIQSPVGATGATRSGSGSVPGSGSLYSDDVGLFAVDASSADEAWAVGSNGGSLGGRTDHWDGSTWTTIAGPVVPHTRLEAVSEESPDDVWAVGYQYLASVGQVRPITEHWNGTGWSVVPVVGAPGYPALEWLFGVTTVSATDAWAVGFRQVPGDNDAWPIILHWDGIHWTRSTPAPVGAMAGLLAVTAISPSDVWAVGFDDSNGLLAHWDGSQWTAVPGPAPGSDYFRYSSVSALGPDDVWVAGVDSDLTSGTDYTLVAHWDGTSWTRVPSYSDPRRSSSLDAIQAISPDDVWAAGTIGKEAHGLAEHWDGKKWRASSIAQAAPDARVLLGMSGSASDDVWSVGLDVTLHWDGTSWSRVAG